MELRTPMHFSLDRRDMLSCAVVAIVGVSGFILGTLTGDEENHGIVIENARGDFLAAPIAATEGSSASAPTKIRPVAGKATAGSFIASQNGEVYYPPGCSGASRIKEENRITFASAALAEGAGYRKAKTCK